jgi:DNA polymerase-1
MVNMMNWLREQVPAEHAVCVFDAKGPTFRDEWYPEYKAQRAPMPEDLRAQIEPIHEAVRLLGWPVLEVPGIEADDAIGTLARVGAERPHRGHLHRRQGPGPAGDAAGDPDQHHGQAARAPGRGGVTEKFGVPPDRIIDYLTLIGDTVDNVPGVPKVGPKTAVKWIQEYGSLDGVIAAAEQIKGVGREPARHPGLAAHGAAHHRQDRLRPGAQVPAWPALDALACARPTRTAWWTSTPATAFAAACGPWASRCPPPPRRAAPPRAKTPRGGAAPAPVLARDYQTLTTWEQLDDWIARLKAAPLTGLDTETDSLDPMRARIVGISFAVEPGRAAYVPTGHDYPGAPDQLPLDEVLARLRPGWKTPARPSWARTSSTTCMCSRTTASGCRAMCTTRCWKAMCWRPTSRTAWRAWPTATWAARPELRGPVRQGRQPDPFSQVDVERASTYSGEDSEMCVQVHDTLWPQLQAEPGLRRVYAEIEMPTVAVLQRIERHGVLIDPARLAAQSQQLAERMIALEQEAYAIAGQPFNMASPKQIGEILFNRLGLPVKKKTATGAPSTDEEVLQELAADYPLPAKLLEHRSLAKLKGTYTDKLPGMINPPPAACTPTTRRRWPSPAGCRATSPTCRTSRSARRRPAGARGLHRPAGPCDRQRRLLADRAAHHGPHQRRPGPEQGLRRGHGRAPRHRQRGLRHRPSR